MIYVVFALFILFIGYQVWLRFRKYYVETNSVRLQYLDNLNNRFQRNMIDYQTTVHGKYAFDTKAKYDNSNNRDRILNEYLLLRKESFNQLVPKIKKNQHYVKLYKKSVENMYTRKPTMALFDQYENQLVNERIIHFDVDFQLVFEFTYTSPKGRNHYSARRILSMTQIQLKLHKLEDEKDQRSAFEIFRDAERAKMTSGLRYDVLERDDFRCQYCGASSNVHNVTLHVDHIKPVAKGGRTKMKNLQTLCRDCNLGKGVKY